MIDDKPDSDVWSEWLLGRRHADDPDYARVIRTLVEGYAERVLDGARLGPEMTLADIGTGEGLVALRAIERIGPSLRVYLTDISAAMLHHAEACAVRRGVRQQCTFFLGPADNLKEIDDASVDVVTTRAVLAYVQDKGAALREFQRILKPGGRISLAEPIFQDEAYAALALKSIVDGQLPEGADRFLPLLHRWKAAQFPDSAEKIAQSPIANYSERDLVRLVQNTGFAEIHMEFHVDVVPSEATSWEVFLGIAPHPLAPPLGVILAERFTPEERQFFEQILRPGVEAGQPVATNRIAYLTARKPAARCESATGDGRS